MVEEQNAYAPPQHSALVVHNRFSIIWIIPIVAALVAGWLGWRSYAVHGPAITITFESAEGLEAGKTKIKHKDTDLGIVERVEPTPDLSHVIVTARMSRLAEPHLTTGTRFWVVRPRLSAEGISDVGTLISGAYIELDPSKGDAARSFTGEESPPIVAANEPGETYTLHATQLGSINQGTPVYFRGIKVGQVLGYELSDTDGSATVHLFVHAPHNKLVRTGTRFWNASGITAVVGSEGMKLQIESIQSLLAGGVAFGVPQNAEAGGIADPKTLFTLYPDATAAHDAVYTRKIHFLLHFPGPVPGLAIGSEVRMQGLKIGQVSDVHIEYDNDTGLIAVPITIEVEADRVTLLHGGDQDPADFEANVYEGFRKLISHGLRARLGSGNLLTGQNVINLDFVADTQAAAMIEGKPYPEIPTLEADDFDSVIHSAKTVLSSLQITVSALNKAVTSPQMQQSMHSLNESLANLDRITQDASTRVGPLLQSLQSVATSADEALKQTNSALAGGAGGGDLAGTLHELKNAARSVRVLTDYLESHPEALLRGKPGNAAQ